MDEITALATILQLIGLYRQEKGGRDDLTSKEFMAWLASHRHDEIRNLISETFHLQDQVNILLREDHTKILQQLEELSTLTLSIARQFDCLAPILEVKPTGIRLPDQAINILTTILNKAAYGVDILTTTRGKKMALLIPTGLATDFTEPQFLEEDCDLLVQLGYFIQSTDSKGFPRYVITRAGSKFGKSLIIAKPVVEENELAE